MFELVMFGLVMFELVMFGLAMFGLAMFGLLTSSYSIYGLTHLLSSIFYFSMLYATNLILEFFLRL